MKQIKKLLIANRGEIALRIIRTAHELGIATVAVYSEADRQSPHVLAAGEAMLLGPGPSAESYLLGDKIIAACKITGADAIHPGYGFLSENAGFARAVKEAGLLFIGPSAESIEVMGSKLAAKKAVSTYDIPLVPGTREAVTSLAEAEDIAQKTGYPLLIKASAGGGGKGMRVVRQESELQEGMDRAISEAKSAFGDGAVFIEKYFTEPKHIEIQLLGDTHGNIVYLHERECSVQRRHQKVVEEAPSPVVDADMRAAMGKAAVDVAKACNYYGAGTVEFIVDENLNFYFLEMNTRLQVEHPVTEMITGLDLVKEQIRIAEGHLLPFKQEDIALNGHALEVRVYAENPLNNFLPDVGTLQRYRRPQGNGIRVDDGYEEGMAIPIFYDPMLAKLISWGETREVAIHKMQRAIDEYHISGVATTLAFCQFVIQHPAFADGSFTTKFVEQYYTPDVLATQLNADEEKAAALVAFLAYQKKGGATEGTTANTSAKADTAWRKRKYPA
jgi:acetyl-CoA carboxylase biotin carboxylase subunit